MGEFCYQCGKGPLSFNEIGLHKKLVNRGAEKFLCMDCLGKEFKVSRELLLQKIEDFKQMGCLLFK